MAPATERSRGAASKGIPQPPRRPFLGRHPRVLDLLERLERLAAGGEPVLLLGETGTGKELLARFLHGASHRGGGPFVPVNCAALPGGTLESELFGVSRGAFTGADAGRAGLIEAAHGGTLFLDEVGDMPAGAQAAVLRALEERSVRRLGETVERPVDFRLVAATHRDLDGAATSFRRDLRWRLGHAVEVPPLRDRATDIPLLVRAFLETAAGGAPPLRVEPAAMAALIRHRYPGNVRELRCRLLGAAALARDGVLRVDDLALPPSGTLLEPVVRSGLPAPLRPMAPPEDRIVAALSGGATASVVLLADVCRLPRRTAQRLLHDMVEGGVLQRTGRGVATRYRLANSRP